MMFKNVICSCLGLVYNAGGEASMYGYSLLVLNLACCLGLHYVRLLMFFSIADSFSSPKAQLLGFYWFGFCSMALVGFSLF